MKSGIWNKGVFRLAAGLSVLDVALIGFGLLRFPNSLMVNSSGWFGLGGDILALSGSLAVLGWSIRKGQRAFPEGSQVGLAIAGIASVIFACQFLVEYLGSLTSSQDGSLANFTFGGLFLLFFLGGFGSGYRQRSAWAGWVVGLWSGILYSLAWVGMLWLTFHLFAGTVQESHFFEIDQTLVDFNNSGMSDLRAFVVQDYLGATFFHPLLGAAAGCGLGAFGGVLGKAAAAFRKTA